MVSIEDLMNMPNEADIGISIPKKDIYEVAKLNTSDKNIFTKYIKKIVWLYKLNEDTIRLKPYHDDKREYDEIEYINIPLKDENCSEIIHDDKYNELTLKEEAKIKRITDIILRFIPYPIVLSFQYKEYIKIFVSHIQDSQIDNEKITLNEIISTNWINTDNMNIFSNRLFENLKLDNLNFRNTYTFYDDVISAIIIYNGEINAETIIDLSVDRINEINNEINRLNIEIEELRNQINKETQFNKKVDLNMKIKILKDKIISLKSELLK